MKDIENMVPKNEKEQKAYDLGVKVGQIKIDILALDLETLNASINTWETTEPMLDPTSYMKYRDKVQQMQQAVRILLKAKHDLQKLKK